MNETKQLNMEDEKLYGYNSLYPERMSRSAKEVVERIKDLNDGEGVLNLGEEEKLELLKWEKDLGEKLEEIYKIKIKRQIFYPDYFLTEEGRQIFRDITGMDILGDNVEEIKEFFYKNRKTIGSLSFKQRIGLGNKSVNYSNASLLKKLQKTVDDDGVIITDDILLPERFDLLINPEELLVKLQRLRVFKKELKTKKENMVSEDEGGNLVEARKIILDLYLRKINEIIVNNFRNVVAVYGVMKYDELTEVEKELVLKIFKFKDIATAYARYDKFIYGASNKYDNTKNRRQISQELRDYAFEMEKLLLDNELEKEKKLKEKGLDITEVFKKNISVERFMAWAEQLLYDKYGQKRMPDNNNGELLEDDSWKIIANTNVKTTEVKSSQKVIRVGIEDRSIYWVMTTFLGHEIEGHVMQNINSEQINLELFKKTKGDRTSVFAEMGAMYVQNKISKEAFGFESIPKPFYVQAMVTKLNGGNYLDCLKTYYDGWRRLILKKKEKGLIDEGEFHRQLNVKLKTAIKSTKRLFRSGINLNEKNLNLLRSRDTAYLEQRIIMQELLTQGLEKYAFILGVNLETLEMLLKIGVINSEKIMAPKLYTLKIWNSIKNEFALV